MTLATWWEQLTCRHHWHAVIDETNPIIGFDAESRIAIRGVNRWSCCWCHVERGPKRGWLWPPSGRGCIYVGKAKHAYKTPQGMAMPSKELVAT